MLIRRCISLSAVIVMATCAGVSSAQEYPTKPVRVITVAVGGGTDLSLRLIAPAVSGGLGQQVVVDNRGGGTIAIDSVAKALPDGYTLLYYGSPLWLTPLLRNSVSFDYERDFLPI